MGMGDIANWFSAIHGNEAAIKDAVNSMTEKGQSVIAPDVQAGRPKGPIKYVWKPTEAPKRGMFGKRPATDPNRIFRGLHHLKTAARYSAGQQWLLDVFNKDLYKLRQKMVKNGTRKPDAEFELGENLWHAHANNICKS